MVQDKGEPMKYILALDFGTTQLKLLLMKGNGQVAVVLTEPYPTNLPMAGWFEQNPADWISALKRGLGHLSGMVDMSAVSGISFSGHMSGVVLLGKDGHVLYPCIMLSDSRSDKECQEIETKAGDLIRGKTGNCPINAFSSPKLLWIKHNLREIYTSAFCWLAPKDYVRYYLTGEICTEYTDAYNSLCVDPNTATWDDEIITRIGLDRKLFPNIVAPTAIVGKVNGPMAKELGLPAGIPVVAGAADMACGSVGMGLGYGDGLAALTIGTSATFLVSVPAVNKKYTGKITYHMQALDHSIYALGSHFNGGLLLNWFTTLFSSSGDIDYDLMDEIAEKASHIPLGSNGLLTVPFWAGSGSPYFSSADRGLMYGYSAATTKADIFRSILEGITYNLYQTQLIFSELIGKQPSILLGGGGMKVKNFPQIIADIFGQDMYLTPNADASAIGAALIGGLGTGLFSNIEKTTASCLGQRTKISCNAYNHSQYRKLFDKYLHMIDKMRQ
jgi:xylulokinase